MQRPIPRVPQTKGLVSSRKRPTLNASPEPAVVDRVSDSAAVRAEGEQTSKQEIESNDDDEERREADGVVRRVVPHCADAGRVTRKRLVVSCTTVYLCQVSRPLNNRAKQTLSITS